MLRTMFKFIITTLIFTIVASSCDDMYSVHQDYLDEGETIYLGKPKIQRVNAGKERVQIIWKLNADPKIKTCCIYWNNKMDSMEVAPNYTDTVMRQIIPLKEGSYIFEMKNKGDDGLYSLTNVASGKAYGEDYINSLLNVKLLKQAKIKDGLSMKWSMMEKCIYTLIQYTTNNGIKKEAQLPGNKTELILNDYQPGSEFSYSSFYIPEEGAIDTIPAHPKTAVFIE